MQALNTDTFDSEAAYDLLRTELKRLHGEPQKDYDAIARVMAEMDRAHREFKFACGRAADRSRHAPSRMSHAALQMN